MKNELLKLSKKHGFKLNPVISFELMENAFNNLNMPDSLCKFYRISNGITHEWFRIPPISDPNNIKNTWNSIQRLNDPETSKYLSGETDFLKRFLLFAELSGPDFGVFDRNDGSIWYSEKESIHDTDLGLLEFIAIGLREVDEL